MDQYIVSARKYRPSTFQSVVGQKALTATLKNAIALDRLAHSYLFCGSRGVGKTSCARIFAKTINCTSPTPDGEACNECDSCRAFNAGTSLNIIELDAASNNGVDDIRELVNQVQIPPSQGRYRVFIIDEVHMLSTAAFNAFLKTLEEPPHYVIFILATTEKHKIIPTILSRCQIYDFARITVADMVDHLKYVAESEGYTAESAALNVIARKADGAMRDALSIFDQVAASSRGHITYQSAIDNLNVLDSGYYNRLLDCFLEGRVLDSWMIYKEIRDKGFNSQFFVNGLADYMRDLMVARDPSTMSLLEADAETAQALAQAAAKCHPEFIYRVMNLCNEADLNYREASNKQFLIELTLARICQLLSPSPNDSGDGEGQLQPIAAASASSSVPASTSGAPSTTVQRPAVPAPQPSAQVQASSQQASGTSVSPAQKPSAPTPAPPAPKRTVKTAPSTARTFSISGNGPAAAESATQSVTTAAQQAAQRTGSYTREQLNQGWQDFMNANPTRHILVNTMRASFPSPTDKEHVYRVMVENDKQREEMLAAMQAIHSHLRSLLLNDSVTIEIELNQGEASPHTWNEREVLVHILNNNPALQGFIDDFHLTIG